MPRKIRVPADPVQSRRNQQRSRARRKEYTAGLERRVREFEERGGRATIDMQRAARAVAWENKRLLELLARRGVSKEEVGEWLLRQPQRDETDTVSQEEVALEEGSLGRREESRSYSHRQQSRGAAGPGPEPGGPADRASAPNDVRSGMSSDARHPREEMGNDTQTKNTTDIVRACDGKTPEATDSGVGPHQSARALVTSCDAAASIIADFQGHGDATQAREFLGCGDARDCHVKNTRLFQLMDEAA